MNQTVLEQVRIVLVEPIGPLNLGSVARVMKNMGLRQLFLVAPKCDRQDEEARKMAVHAIDILEAATIVESIPAALIGCTRAIATTSVTRHNSAIALENPRTALPWLLEGEPSALIFGSEDRGLSNDELKYAQRFIRIPSSDVYDSLNLAQAVAVCSYEMYQMAIARDRPIPTPPVAENHLTAPLDVLEQYYQHLETVLLKIGYLYPHTAPSRMAKFRLLLNRSFPSETEVAMLRGILRQIEWAIGNRQAQTGANAIDPQETTDQFSSASGDRAGQTPDL
jgi:tRNA/rRNA methyltransferase